MYNRMSGKISLRGPLYASPLFYPVYAVKAALLLRKLDCDIVHIHNLTQFVPLVRSFNPQSKIILHMHCEWLTELPGNLVRKRLSGVDCVLGCSDFVIRQVRERFPEIASKCHVVFNGADLSSRSGTSEKKGFAVLYVGRISPEKGLHVLISAFREVSRQVPNSQLVIVGPEAVPSADIASTWTKDANFESIRPLLGGGYLTYLRKQSSGLNVLFRDSMPHEDLASLYATADVLAFPSVWNEPFGMPIVEAMAYGVPVVATQSGGIPEIVVHGETGLLVARGDAMALAQAIVTMATERDAAQHMGEKGLFRFRRHFTWDKIAGDVAEIYRGVLEN